MRSRSPGGTLPGLEEPQQRGGGKLEDEQPHQHDAHCVADAEPDGLHDPGGLPRAVVIGHDGHHPVVQSEDGHEDEGLELEVHAKDGGGRLGEGDQDLVHPKDHHRADGLHDDGGNAHAVNTSDDGAAGPEAPHRQMEVRILL